MEKRIELEKRARKASQIIDLNLDNCRSTSIVGLTDEYTALESLSLINVGLTTLRGFPKLPNLKKLELSDNRISNGLNYLTTSPKLQYLNLSGNKIKDLDTLKPLEEFKNLAVLDLFNNEATQIENYREKIFKMLPSLKFLDGFDLNDDEAPSEGDDGDDDDEVIENGSDDEAQGNAFCLNGLEIDLDELAEFEKRVKAKKQALSTTEATGNEIKSAETLDELDEYLKELKIEEESKIQSATSIHRNINNNNKLESISFAILLYWFLAIINLANAAYFSSSSSPAEDDDDDQDDCEVDDDDNSYVSLSEVYNEDLEEYSSDWVEEDGADGAEEDEDEDSDEDEAAGDPNQSATKTTEQKVDGQEAGDDENQARGKKRKHDG